MESSIETLKSDDQEKKAKELDILVEKFDKEFVFPELEIKDNRLKLWTVLCNILLDNKQNALHLKSLSLIRLISRDKAHLNDLVSEEFLQIIINHSGLTSDDLGLSAISPELIEAVKCLFNLAYNATVPRAILCKLGILQALIKRIKAFMNTDDAIELRKMDSKVVFIITALNSETRDKINNEMNGLQVLTEALQDIIRRNQDKGTKMENSIADLASQLMKILYNLTISYNKEDDIDKSLAKLCRELLLLQADSEEKTQALHLDVVNLLTNLPEEDLEKLYVPISEEDNLPPHLTYDGKDMSAVYQILQVLQQKLTTEPSVSTQHSVLSPVLLALHRCAQSFRLLRKYLKREVLPPLKDVHNRPEEGNSLRNYLCRLLTSPITQVRDLTADFLFILCRENVRRMIKYTGYGNAAGMFANRGLLIAKSPEVGGKYSSDSEDSDTEEYLKHEEGINPVLGCYQPDKPNPCENMTEEQKEEEAMKFVNLVDNLTRIGIIQPCTVGEDGKPKPIEHVLQLQEAILKEYGKPPVENDDD